MDYCVLENLHWKIEMEPVLKTMDCYEDSPVYEEVVEEYEENIEEMKRLVEPVGILGMGKLSEAIATEKYKAGTPVIFAVLSVGNGLKEESTRAFQEGNYVKGMLVDAMADAALFPWRRRRKPGKLLSWKSISGSKSAAALCSTR